MRLNSVSVLTSIFIVSLSVAPCLVTSQSSHSCSQQQRTRQEWRQLTYTQQQEFISGVKLLKTQVPSIMGQKSRYDDFVLIHSNSGPLIHSTPQFYPWHRKMLADFETELQKVLNNPKFALPYYDWTIDAKNPQASPLLQPGALGTDAAQSASTCLSDGPFSGWNKTVPSAGCVSRGGVSSSVTNYDVVAVECVIQRDNGYDDFRTYAEVPHNSFHVNFGGDMSDIKSSPNDPIFYLHHCNVDRWWFRWQRIRDTSFNDYTAGAQGLSTKLTFFNTPVSSVMDASGSLCYTYSSSWETNVNFNGYQCPGVGGAVLLNENAAGLVIAGNGSINTTGGGGSNNNSTASSTGATNTNSSISLLNGTTPGVNVSSVLTNPPPLPQSFLDQHGMNATQVAIVEGNLNQLSGVNINNLFSGSGSGDVSNRSSSSQSTGSKTSGSLPMVKSASTSITAAAAAAAALFMAVVVDLIL